MQTPMPRLAHPPRLVIQPKLLGFMKIQVIHV
jgi:hypothetical protein